MAPARDTKPLLKVTVAMLAVALAVGMLPLIIIEVDAQGSPDDSGALEEGRFWHTATKLRDGSVLVVGGLGPDSGAPLASAELYDPSTGVFTTVGPLAEARVLPTATVLTDGRVLIVGGDGILADDVRRAVRSAELYDPATRTFTTVGSLTTKRVRHTATVLTDGRVLIVGGETSVADDIGSADRSAELYDPETQAFTIVGPMQAERQSHTATLLDDGQVLIVGASDLDPLAAELYDPDSQAFSPVGSPGPRLVMHTATKLNDGRILIAGGIDFDDEEPTSWAGIYDPATREFTQVGSLAQPLVGHAATLLRDGRVLIAGGGPSFFDWVASVEIFDPVTEEFTKGASLLSAHGLHTSNLLEDGRVLIVGGGDPAAAVTTELYDPSDVPPAGGQGSLTEPRPEPTPIIGPLYSRGTVGLSLDGLGTAIEARAICRLADGGRRVRSVVADRRIRLGGVWVTLELRLREDGPRLRLLTSPDIKPQTIYRSTEATGIEASDGPDRSGSVRFEGLRLHRGRPLDLPGRARSLDGSLTWSCLLPPELGGPEPEGDPDPDDRGGLSGQVTMSSLAGSSTVAALDLTGACDDPDHGFSFWSKAVAWPDGRRVNVQLQNMEGDMYVSIAPSGAKTDTIAVGAVSEPIVPDWPDFAVEGRLETVDGDVLLVTGAWRCR